MRRPGDDPGDGVGDVLRGQWRGPLVHRRGLLLVAPEPDQRELRLDHPWRDLADPDRLAEQLEPQRPGDRVHRVLGGRIAAPARIDLDSGDRADHDYVAAALALQGGKERL